MSLFESIKKAIFHNPLAKKDASAPRPAAPATNTRPPAAPSAARPATTGAATGAAAGSATQASATQTSGTQAPRPATPAAGGSAPQPEAVDVEEVLEGLSAKNPQKLNWRTSIVDLMKLLDLDSSLKHRQELAVELGYTGDKNDSAAMNIWLHKAVMRKLAENGGKVPATLQ